MKIVEALHERKNIEKRIISAQKNLNLYSSATSTEKPVFGSDEVQKKEVSSILQSITDMTRRYIWLSEKITITNLKTIVMIGGFKASIHEFLEWKRRGCDFMLKTFSSLNENTGNARLKSAPQYDKESKPFIVRFYDEKEKNNLIRKYTNLLELITPNLEVINATTDLIENDIVDIKE